LSRIANVFQNPAHRALLTYLVTGYPDTETTVAAGLALAKNGADIIELGIPFSDPLADGTTIQQASHLALERGITVRKCLEVVARLREQIATPLVLMTYFNPVYHYGIEDFCRDAAAAGADGLIVPDLPPEEGGALEEACTTNDLDLIYLLAPTSTPERIRRITASASGFVYYVSLKGVTGASNIDITAVSEKLQQIRASTDMPVGVGFGIKDAETAAAMGQIADAVVVGSALVSRVEEYAGDTPRILASVGEVLSSMRSALDAG